MGICHLCGSIPLEDDRLPELPDWALRGATKSRYIHQLYDRPLAEDKVIKFAYHPNLESLQSSAVDCKLCHLVLDRVEKAIEELLIPDPYIGRKPTQPTWKFWLTRRKLGAGFYVFTDCQDTKDFCFVAAIGICVDEGDALHSVYPGRTIEEEPSNSRTMARVSDWVDQCNDHPNCTVELPVLPTRVIDLGDGTNEDRICLREIHGERGRYISLSYCWGKAKHTTTTKASLASHKTNIIYDQLPKTFKDAIAITRLLGIRYLWIDSICICQDDTEDWERESARMTSVYSNSYLTIAASAAADSTMGCYIRRKKTEYVRVNNQTKHNITGELQMFALPMRKEARGSLYLGFADNIGETDHPLATRAWAVQERVLPRRTLHFGKHQMYFECNEGFRGENGLQIPARFQSIYASETWPFRQIPEEERKVFIRLWRDILLEYGRRTLTKPSDKLPAISGLARVIAERLGDDEYLAGMWRNSLVEDLLWQGIRIHRVSEYRAPSWSWASCDGAPIIGIRFKWEPVAEILGYEIKTKAKNTFGEVDSGWIKLRAPLIRLIMDERPHPNSNFPKVQTQHGNPRGFVAGIDSDFSGTKGREETLAQIKSLKGIDIFALILVKALPDEELDVEKYRGLIVRPARSDTTSLERLGCITGYAKDFGEYSQLEHVEERPTVTLI